MEIPGFEPYGESDPYIFVSYCHQDTDVIDDLNYLESAGFRIWYDKRMATGVLWRTLIEEKIKRGTVFMVFVSEASANSDEVLLEVKSALAARGSQTKEGKEKILTIIAVFLDGPGVALKYGLLSALRELQCIDRMNYKNQEEQYRRELVGEIQAIAEETRESRYERDSKNLGLGYLPKLDEILCGAPDLDQHEREKRRRDAVHAISSARIKTYVLDSVFQITSTPAMQRLGEVKLLDDYPSKPHNLLSFPVDIETAYIAPLRLISGLITRLHANWPPLVSSYSQLVKKEAIDGLEELHYFVEFCWLAWGPSVLNNALAGEDSEFMIVQAAYGDEANSLPLIMKRAKWEAMEGNMGGRYGGWPAHVRNALVVRPGADPFFGAIRNYPLFRDIYSDPKAIALYLPHNDEGCEGGALEALPVTDYAFYSTAYVWLMIEQINPGISDVNRTLQPGKVIPFFEHANLAAYKGLDFLQHCLARKAIYHILECERDPDYRDQGFYRFAYALFPEQMVEILEMEKCKLGLKDQAIVERRLNVSRLPSDWRSPVEIVQFADAVTNKIKEALKERPKRPHVSRT